MNKKEEETTLATEIEKMPYEPLLPIEKKLITWSIVLGVILLGVLTWASRVLIAG